VTCTYWNVRWTIFWIMPSDIHPPMVK